MRLTNKYLPHICLSSFHFSYCISVDFYYLLLKLFLEVRPITVYTLDGRNEKLVVSLIQVLKIIEIQIKEYK